MQARFLPLLFVVLLPLSLAAQNSDRVEVFGGYSYTRYSVYDKYSGPWTPASYNGGEASAAFKLAPHIAAEGDFSAGTGSPFGSSSSLRTYLFGPRISADFGHATVFGHVLFGGLTFSISGASATSFATALGGGADFWFTHHIGARPIQVDYLLNSNTAAAQNLASSTSRSHYRIATGVVFRF